MELESTESPDGAKLLPNSRECFVCGEDNHAGLKARFYAKDGMVHARWQPRALHCGYQNVVHGGVVAAILDECMAWTASRYLGLMCVTGELTVRYLSRVPSDRELMVSAEVTQPGRRIVHVTGHIRDDAGEEYARAHGKFVPMSAAETLAVDDALLYRGEEERVFDGLRAKTGVKETKSDG